MKWGDKLVKYYNMITTGKTLCSCTREFGNDEIYIFMLWYVNGGKN